MRDEQCIEFLQWALPRLGLRWPGFRKVRSQVCRRIDRRRRELGLFDLDTYRAYIEATPQEWQELDRLCVVTISRFYRDRRVFDFLAATVLPVLAATAAQTRRAVAAWSAGCASGEEPYSLALTWSFAVGPRFPTVGMEILATDVDEKVLDRARHARYPASSLRDLPEPWRRRAFVRRGDVFHLRPAYTRMVTVGPHDLRDPAPNGPFDLVLCRNVAFTYFSSELQKETTARLEFCLREGGALVIGSHETLPEQCALVPWRRGLPVYGRPGAIANGSRTKVR
jgi:chemotaxis protein methyltransferase CheR